MRELHEYLSLSSNLYCLLMLYGRDSMIEMRYECEMDIDKSCNGDEFWFKCWFTYWAFELTPLFCMILQVVDEYATGRGVDMRDCSGPLSIVPSFDHFDIYMILYRYYDVSYTLYFIWEKSVHSTFCFIRFSYIIQYWVTIFYLLY